jgi:hypothetical protein
MQDGREGFARPQMQCRRGNRLLQRTQLLWAKKGPDVAVRAGKFWERMPERHVPYDLRRSISQVRKRQNMLQNLQLDVGKHRMRG